MEREHILIKARRKAKFPAELGIKGSLAYAGITRRVQGPRLCSQLCYTTPRLPSPLPLVPTASLGSPRLI